MVMMETTSQKFPFIKKSTKEIYFVKLLDQFAIRRSNQAFWAFSDHVHQWYKQDQPIEFGLLDYNRFENRLDLSFLRAHR
ncbi:fatty acid cis/trans isomerase [Vibrio tapetis subsp. quintayensis]|uniref:fatty acid cis/trans isomerase n=1 Tax=Vibrio tapetis TaxID=52443 RepID=UPI0025B39184|nr:fatty acid cis/trans isomerase [Vibrio tapetis]MDN3678738.1 fatty acid cis/trans isomerase [Vibrio tapetis subsp. quintayensis]